MKATRDQVLAMLKELGNFPTAPQWDEATMKKRLGKLGTLLSGGDQKCKTEGSQDLLDALVALGDDDVLELTGDFPAAGKRGKAASEGADKDGKAAGKGKKKGGAGGNGEVGRDKLGARLGSQAAQINAALTKKPTAPADLAKATGLGLTRVNAHLASLIRKEKAEKTDKGYKLVGK